MGALYYFLIAVSSCLVRFSLAVALTRSDVACAPVGSIVVDMTKGASDPSLQQFGCEQLSSCVDSSHTAQQNAAAEAGAMDAAVNAMARFPDVMQVQGACISALGAATLMNPKNVARAGQLGALNLSVAAYKKWPHEPALTRRGWAIGAVIGTPVDTSDENRRKFRLLGGVPLFLKTIRNNFHGPHSQWDHEQVKESLYALSTGTWGSEDVAHAAGFIDLALQLMDEHASEPNIAEETLQAVKTMIFRDDYRNEFAHKGLARTLAKVLRERPSDKGALSLACNTAASAVGPFTMRGPAGRVALKMHNHELQDIATREGLLDQLIRTNMQGAQLQHAGHHFDGDIDAAYNARADCLEALTNMALFSVSNVQTILSAGVMDHLVQHDFDSLDRRSQDQVCILMGLLMTDRANETANSLATSRGLVSSCLTALATSVK